jgi:hypothetical protein
LVVSSPCASSVTSFCARASSFWDMHRDTLTIGMLSTLSSDSDSIRPKHRNSFSRAFCSAISRWIRAVAPSRSVYWKLPLAAALLLSRFLNRCAAAFCESLFIVCLLFSLDSRWISLGAAFELGAGEFGCSRVPRSGRP